MNRNICFITGTRAEYGLLRPLIKTVSSDPSLDYSIICTCMHLSPEFGLTYREIEKDGFSIDRRIEMLLSSDTPSGITKSIGLGIIGFADAFSELNPDIVVLLGDRFETLAAATAACVACLPIAHIHGGELTQGAMDEAFRHAITKMSSLHFTSTEAYRKRVVQLGENPKKVFNVGALGVENIRTTGLLTLDQLESEIDFKLDPNYLLVTFHPATLEDTSAQDQFGQLLRALDDFSDMKIIFTKANADAGGRVVNQMIDSYTEKNADKTIAFNSMGQIRYLSALQFSRAVVGNSSSGIVEAPSFRVPTVNIGSRQDGRIKADSVIDCRSQADDIKRSLRIALSKQFQKKIACCSNPYEKNATSESIKSELENIDLEGIVMKVFYDLK